MRKIRRKCNICSVEYEAPVKEVNRGRQITCSRSCGSKLAALTLGKCGMLLTCSYCGKEFNRAPSRVKRSRHGYYFCCRKCKDKAQAIGGIEAIRPWHYKVGETSYRRKAFRHKKPECEECGFNRYKKVLIVHHKDRNRRNNKIENLAILCPTCHEVDHLLGGDGRFKSNGLVA